MCIVNSAVLPPSLIVFFLVELKIRQIKSRPRHNIIKKGKFKRRTDVKDVMGQIFRTSPLFPTVTKRLPPPFIWLGQYLNTTTTNYPIKGWCVYHFGLVNTWRNGNICTIGFLPHHDEIGESCSFVCFVQYQFMVGYFRYLVERRLVVSQINQSFLLSPTTSSENNVQPSRQKMDQNVSLPKLS